MTSIDRRSLIQAGATMALASPFTALLGDLVSVANAQTASNGDYRALLCVYLGGGNDSHNTVLSTDPTTWQQYLDARADIALKKDELLPLKDRNSKRLNTGREFALHPSFTALAEIWSAGHLAIVPNVGPLIRPTLRSELIAKTAAVPRFLYSHNHQTWTWQKLDVVRESEGWGGRVAELFNTNMKNDAWRNLSAMTMGQSHWGAASDVRPFQLLSNLGHNLNALSDGYLTDSQKSVIRTLQSTNRASLLRQDWSQLMTESLDLHSRLADQLKQTDAVPKAPDTYSDRFRTILQGIIAGKSLGLRRQIFFVGGPGGFDSHFDVPGLSQHYTKLNVAFKYFYDQLKARGLLDSVTLFTASEFGRTLKSNGSGSDHGWGGHHFVMGGAVNGGEVYGRFPNVGLGTEDDHVSGSLIPSTSLDQYAATLSRWLGLSDAQLNEVFPNLRNFGSEPFLDFLRA